MGRLRITDDIVRYLSTFQRLGETVEVQLPGELLPVGARTVFRALRTRAAAQLGVDWVWPYWLDRQLDPASPAFVPRGHLPVLANVTQRNWTMVGNVGSPWEAIVDPRGLVTPWFDGWSLDWWIGADDRWHLPSREIAVRQRLVDLAPVVETAMRVPGGDAVHRVYAAVPPGGADDLVVVEIENRSPTPFAVALAVRPYNPEGLAVVERIALHDRTVAVDGRPALLLPTVPQRMAGSTFHDGDVVETVVSGAGGYDVPQAAALRGRPGPGRLPVPAGPPGHAARCRAAHARAPHPAPPARPAPGRAHAGAVAGAPVGGDGGAWLAGAGRPRPAPRAARRPADRGGGGQPALHARAARRRRDHARARTRTTASGSATPRSCWPPSTATASTTRSAEVLRSYPGRQHVDGFFFSQRQEWDANGAALWAMAEHWRLTGDDALLGELSTAVERGARWIGRKRRSKRRRNDPALVGLMPASISAEHLGPFDYFYWDDFWSLRGLLDGAELARVMGSQRGGGRLRRGPVDFERRSSGRSTWWPSGSPPGPSLPGPGGGSTRHHRLAGRVLTAAPAGRRPSGDGRHRRCHPRPVLHRPRLLPGDQPHRAWAPTSPCSWPPSSWRRATGGPSTGWLDGRGGHADLHLARGHPPAARRGLHGRRPPRLGGGRVPLVRAQHARSGDRPGRPVRCGSRRRWPGPVHDVARRLERAEPRGARRAHPSRPPVVRGALARRASGPAVGARDAAGAGAGAPDRPRSRSHLVDNRAQGRDAVAGPAS